MTDSGGLAGTRAGCVVVTREGLRDGSLLAALRARTVPGLTLRSDMELEASLDQMLSVHDPAASVWIFGYGSLMWNPAFRYIERRSGTLYGRHRRFCLQLRIGRGTPDRPGLMLALDRGGMCRGVAFSIPAAEVRTELLLVWRREMLSGAYLARWVRVHTCAGPVRAVTFVANREYEGYTGRIDEHEIAVRIATASGEFGTCASYLQQTVNHLHALGRRDVGLERVHRAVEAYRAALPSR